MCNNATYDNFKYMCKNASYGMTYWFIKSCPQLYAVRDIDMW